MRTFIYLATIFLWVGFSQAVFAHPADGRTPRRLPSGYGSEHYGYPPDYNFADIVFQESFPDPETLSDAEKYIISGAQSDGFSALYPWWYEVFTTIDLHEKMHGYIPAVLDEDAIRRCFENGEADAALIDRLRSPLTGDFPRTDQVNNSAGDLYCRKLTDQEISLISELDPRLRELRQNSQWINPETGDWEQATLTTGVYYIRIYGWNDVIYECIQFGVGVL
jgi:hypothetical protein